MQEDRRDFIKKTCILCAGIAGGLGFSSLLTSCVSFPRVKASVKQHTVEIPLSSFAEGNMIIITPKEYYYDILVVKKSDTEYNAVLMKCSHQDNMLIATKSGLNCTLHGSNFDLNGKPLSGPAINPLTRFPTEISGSSLIVKNVPTDY
ncbi:MAG: ubiquinol-cytochrome c reductase iron-sulfur subunit [Cytophagaceae bacterium]|jgi:Rieske Fe-S protein